MLLYSKFTDLVVLYSKTIEFVITFPISKLLALEAKFRDALSDKSAKHIIQTRAQTSLGGLYCGTNILSHTKRPLNFTIDETNYPNYYLITSLQTKNGRDINMRTDAVPDQKKKRWEFFSSQQIVFCSGSKKGFV